MVKILRTPAAVRRWRGECEGAVVLVPTMGALHEGHAALIRKARAIVGSGGSVMVSVFVNPTQFGPNEDFSAYPRPVAADKAICAANGADAIFMPSVAAMYAPDHSVWIDEDALSGSLCGRSRPGHFRGVCTVVAKLFLIVEPDAAIFGEKDWQQLAIIRRMVRDLNFPIRIFGFGTVREKDGLATSSRNAYLTADERAVAPRIQAALVAAARKRKPSDVVSAAKAEIEKIPGARIDYVEAVDAATLEPLAKRDRPGRLAAAVFLGRARLIDNIPLDPLKK